MIPPFTLRHNLESSCLITLPSQFHRVETDFPMEDLYANPQRQWYMQSLRRMPITSYRARARGRPFQYRPRPAHETRRHRRQAATDSI